MEHSGSATPTVVSLVERKPKTAERRSARRHMTVLRVGKIMSGDSEQLCMIRNISGGGLMAHVYSHHIPGDRVAIEIKNGHVLTGHVIWSEAFMAGIEFDERIDVLNFLAVEQTDMLFGKVPRAPRLKAHAAAVIRRGAHYVHAGIADISQGGARVSEGEAFDANDNVVVMVPGLPPVAGSVRWRREGYAGVSFNELIPFEALAVWAAQHDRETGTRAFPSS